MQVGWVGWVGWGWWWGWDTTHKGPVTSSSQKFSNWLILSQRANNAENIFRAWYRHVNINHTCISFFINLFGDSWFLGISLHRSHLDMDWSGDHFKNIYELLNLKSLLFSPLNKISIFKCMGMDTFCVEFQSVPLKFHTTCLTHVLKDIILIKCENSKSS